MAADDAGEDIVDNDEIRDRAQRGRQQRLCDARRHDRRVGGLRMGDADEAVHDAHTVPNRPTNGEMAPMVAETVAAAHVAAVGRHAALEAEAGTLFNAVVVVGFRRQLQLICASFSNTALTLSGPKFCASSRLHPTSALRPAPAVRGADGALGPQQFAAFGEQNGRVTIEASTGPIITAFTTASACWYMPQTDRSMPRVSGGWIVGAGFTGVMLSGAAAAGAVVGATLSVTAGLAAGACALPASPTTSTIEAIRLRPKALPHCARLAERS